MATRKTKHTATKDAAGPLTLDEARKLAGVKATKPARAMKVAKSAIGTTARRAATPYSLALERRRLERRNDEEVARRIREYRATMDLLVKRGLRVPGGKPVGKAKAVESASTKPLRVLAEGDSWFDYPVFLGNGIVDRLTRRIGTPIQNLAAAGDEVRFMLGAKQREKLAAALNAGSASDGAPWDALLFSGGGNDVSDNPLVLWIKEFDAGVPPKDLIDRQRFSAILALVRAGYEDLIALRDRLSPQTHLFFHGYDFAIPDGRGVCHLGPWLKPSFDVRKFPRFDKSPAATEVVHAMLESFAAMLSSLTSHKRVTIVPTQGTLVQKPSSWHNELHPSSDGFDRFAELFHEALRKAFPGRVP